MNDAWHVSSHSPRGRVGRTRCLVAVYAAALFALGATAMADRLHAQPAPAPAAEQANVYAFDIPAGPLAGALEAFGLQASLPVTVDESRVAGLTTAGLRGRYDLKSGLDTLLKGTGYVAALDEQGRYVLVPEPPAPG